MKVIELIIKKSFGIAAASILSGFICMSLGNTPYFDRFGFMSITLAPNLIIFGYVLIVIGIIRKPIND